MSQLKNSKYQRHHPDAPYTSPEPGRPETVEENQNPKIIENEMQKSGNQLLGFLAPGGVGLVLSAGQTAGTAGATPPVMAIPIAALFVKHEKCRKIAASKSA